MHSGKFEPFKLWYGEVPGAYRHYVASQCTNDEKLGALEAQLILRKANTEQDDQKALMQLDALEHIRHVDHTLLTLRAFAVPFDQKCRVLSLKGVIVRVAPTNLLTMDRLGYREQSVGVLKPLLRKSRALSPEEGRIYTALLHWFAEVELGHIGTASADLCAVCDVFARKLHFASGRTTKVRSIIEANCQEIADRWPSFTPRPAAEKQATSRLTLKG